LQDPHDTPKSQGTTGAAVGWSYGFGRSAGSGLSHAARRREDGRVMLVKSTERWMD